MSIKWNNPKQMKGRVIPAGKIVALTKGEYSGYELVDVARFRIEVTAEEAVALFLKAHPDQSIESRFCSTKFASWLFEIGMAERIDSGGGWIIPLGVGPIWAEWHLGGYGGVEEMEIITLEDDEE